MIYTTTTRLPVDPVARRQPDGSVIYVLRYNRHLIEMPTLVFPAHSCLAGRAINEIGQTFGHLEYLVTLARIDTLQSNADALLELTDRDVILLADLADLLPIVIRKARGGIAARWPSTHLLPVFGNWPTFSDVQERFRVRDGRQEVYDAIGFLHAVNASLDLIEGRLGPKSRALIGLAGGRGNV